jgi:uracil phosphoribosyltransferase
MTMHVTVLDHPLVAHKLTILRDKTTPSSEFRQLVSELVTLEAYEATREMTVKPKTVQTPVGTAHGVRLDQNPRPIVIPILRAGLGMLDGMMRLLPMAEVGFLGMKRNEETLDIITYAERLPEDLSGRECFLLDPMLATGGTLATALKYVKDHGAKSITAIDIIGAKPGIERLKKEVPEDIDFNVVLCGLDDKLNDAGYIVPGLGDAGDRLYGALSWKR